MLWASVAAAQAPVLNPRFLEFNASTDHSTNAPTGVPLVTRYNLEFYNIGAPSPFQTNPLGKPTPNASGVIRIDLSTTFAGLPTGTTYESRVVAVGPGGAGRSNPSNQFAFTNPCAVTISPTAASVGATASTGSVGVTTGPGCAWSAVSNAAWVTISSGASGSGNGTVNYSIAANTVPTPRNAALTIGGQTFNISQAAGCTFAISPTTLSVTSEARTGTVSVSTTTGCAWTTASSAPWITVTSGSSGSGNGSVGYSVAANTTISPRTGVVTIAGQAFTLTQAGIPCTATLSPTGVAVDPAPATGSIAVSIPAGCTWTATDDASWVSITSGASGTGNGTVAYSIGTNPNTTQRTATITVAGQSFGITQAGVVCSTTISPTASSPTSAGGPGTVAVTANAGSCAWTSTSTASWIAITGGASGTGSGSVSYNVAANTLTTSRTGTMTIAGQTMTVTQSGAPCNYTISPTVANLGPSTSTNTVAVSSPSGCAWTATENATWISITERNPWIRKRDGNLWRHCQPDDHAAQRGDDDRRPDVQRQSGGPDLHLHADTGGGVGIGDRDDRHGGRRGAGRLRMDGDVVGAVGDDYERRERQRERHGRLLGGRERDDQSAHRGAHDRRSAVHDYTSRRAMHLRGYTATPSLPASGGPGTVTLTTQAGCAWTATTSAAWITIGGTGTGTGSDAINYTVAVNPNPTARSGTIAVGGQIVTLSQAAAPCNYTLSPGSISVGSDAATGTFSIAATAGCSWNATSSAPWLSITTPASGSGNGSIGYSVGANPNTSVRTGTISVGGQSFTVTQAAVVCSTAISPTASSPTSAGGPGTVAVTANAGSCAWTSTSTASWITITGGASGTGSGSVSYNVAANTLTTSRTGTMTIAGQTMTVTQGGAPCNYAISPTVANLGPSTSTNTVAVTSAAGCAWTANENATWISITSGTPGSGNGTVTYSVTANPTITPRSAVMTIAGQTFDVNQAGQTCTYTLTPAGASVLATATTGTVDVATLGGCAWTATSSAPWVTITSGGSGSASGTVGYSVAANTTTSPRTGTLTIGGQPFTVTQAGGPCTYSATTATPSLPASGGPGTVTLTTQAGCAWTATTSAAWMTIGGTGTGTGSGSIPYTLAANPDATPRNGTIAVGGQVVAISQAAAPCNYTLSPGSISVGSDAATGTFSIAATAGCSWNATSSASWLSITTPASGSGNGSIGYSVGANPNTSVRTGTISVGGQSFTVTQAAVVCSLAISPTASSPTAAGGAGTVSVTANAGSCAWTSTSNASWITITAGASGSGPGSVAYTVAANVSTAGRTGTMTIAGQTFTVTQAGAPCNFAISPTVANLGPSASTNTIEVTAAAGCAWAAAETASWISITSGASGSGDGTVTYSVIANVTTSPRNAMITVAGQSFNVIQAGQPCTYTLTPAGAAVQAAATIGTVDVAALGSCAWTATSSAPWVTITSGGSGSGNGTVGYSVASNTTTSPRTGTLTIGGQPFTITQGAATCSYAASPPTPSFNASGGAGTVTLTTQAGCAWTATTSASWITINGSGNGTGSGTVDYTVAVNPDGFGRGGTIAVGAQIVTVSQAAATCTMFLSPASVSVGSDASAGSFSVDSPNGCGWTATSNATWLTITSAASGSGDGTIGYGVAANTVPVQRSAAITVGGRTFTVTQAAPACTFTLSSTSVSVSSGATTGNISVTSVSGCAWTAVSADSWITVTSGASGSGSGAVVLSIAANPTGTQRIGSVTIAGQTVTVTQAGVTCSPGISPTSVSAPYGVTSGNVSVTATGGCSWTATSNTSWITITAGASGSGDGVVSYSIAENTGGSTRSGSLTIGTRTFGVTQSARTCSFAVDPAAVTLGADGATESVDMITAAGCNWTAATSTPWITIVSGGSGSGNGTIVFSVAPNTSTSVRSGSITAGGRTFQISQIGTCSYSMSPSSVSGGAGGTSTTVFVFTQSGCSWSAASNAPWLSVNAGSSGTGSGSVTVSASANNSGAARTGTATIAGQIFSLTQNACGYSVSPTTVSASGSGSTSNAFISTTSSCNWSASSEVSWITLTDGNSGSGTSWLRYTVAPNQGSSPRAGTITIAGRTLTVNQAAAACTATVTPADVEASKNGGMVTVTVATGSGCSWTIQDTLSWVTVAPANGGTGSATVTLQIDPNPLAFPRTATISVANKLIVISQSAVAAPPSAPGGFRIVP